MKNLYLLLLFVLFVAFSSFSQTFDFTSVDEDGVLDWNVPTTWLPVNGVDIPASTNTVLIQSYVDRSGPLDFDGPGNRVTVGIDAPLDEEEVEDVTSYDLLIVRGDLNLDKGNSSDPNGFTIYENGIMVVFGDVIWDKNKALISNSGILAITGSLIGKGSSVQNEYENNGQGLLFLYATPEETFPVDRFDVPLDVIDNDVLSDIDNDLCNADFLADDPRKTILNYLCDFIQQEGSSPLPVELISFTAMPKDDGVELAWQTSTEINNDFFTVERSYNGLDYEEIGRVNGNGNSNIIRHYIFNDFRTLPGRVYYRLSQTDFDGTTEVFDPVAVNFTTATQAMTLYPNPVGEELVRLRVIGLDEDREAFLHVTDLTGKSIYRRPLEVERAGAVVVELDIASKLTRGAYILSVVQNGLSFKEKLVRW